MLLVFLCYRYYPRYKKKTLAISIVIITISFSSLKGVVLREKEYTNNSNIHNSSQCIFWSSRHKICLIVSFLKSKNKIKKSLTAIVHTCQVTRFRRVTPGNRACHPHFPEHPSMMTRNHPELVQILEIFIYSKNTRILPIERTTIRMVNCNQQQYTFEVLSN